MTREERIRALAGQILTGSDAVAAKLSTGNLVRVAEMAIEEAARIIDAIDALPVPRAIDGRDDCQECKGEGGYTAHFPTARIPCGACNGTGKASE